MGHGHERGRGASLLVVVVVVVVVDGSVVSGSVDVDAAPEAVAVSTPHSGLFALARLRKSRLGIDELSQ